MNLQAAVHEAGHALFGILHGNNVCEIKLTRRGLRDGHTNFTVANDTASNSLLYLMGSYTCGFVSERLIVGERASKMACMEDYLAARCLAGRMLANQFSTKLLFLTKFLYMFTKKATQLIRYSEEFAQQTLQPHLPALKSLSYSLLQRKCLKEGDILEIISTCRIPA